MVNKNIIYLALVLGIIIDYKILDRKLELIWMIVFFVMCSILILYNPDKSQLENFTNDEAVANIAALYNNSGTMTIPNLVVTNG